MGEIRQDVAIGRFVTSETVSLGISGFSSGLVAGLLWRAAGRTRLGVAPFVTGVLVAAVLTGRFDRPGWYPMIAAGAVVTALAGVGAVRFLADPAVQWEWVAAGGLVSVFGVWAGVPETGPALLVGGVLMGLAVIAAKTGVPWAPSAGFGVMAILGWAALSGAAGRPWAALGSTLCTGVAPGFGLVRLLMPDRGSRCPRLWVFGAHIALVFLAARWVAVDPDAGWIRVSIMAIAGGLVAITNRAQA